jgi:hypothetical protein
MNQDNDKKNKNRCNKKETSEVSVILIAAFLIT